MRTRACLNQTPNLLLTPKTHKYRLGTSLNPTPYFSLPIFTPNMQAKTVCPVIYWIIARAADETQLWLSSSTKQRRNPCSGSPPVYVNLSTRHDWPVKNAMVDLPIKMKENSKRSSGNSLSPLEPQNKDIGTALQTLLMEIELRLQRRLLNY